MKIGHKIYLRSFFHTEVYLAEVVGIFSDDFGETATIVKINGHMELFYNIENSIATLEEYIMCENKRKLKEEIEKLQKELANL